MATGESVQLVHRWFDEVWNNPRAGAVEELFAEEGRLVGVGGEAVVGREAFRGFRAAFQSAFSDFNIRVTEAHESGDTVFLHLKIEMAHRGSGRRISTDAAGWGRFANGQLTEAGNFINFLEVLIQMGAAPEDALERALGGERLVVAAG